MKTPHEPDRVRYLFDQRVPTRDGLELSVDVVLPRGGGPFPVILSRDPYESNSQRTLERGFWWARHNYAFVAADCRGRYESEGAFYPHHPDGRDGVDTLEWLVGQSWCNGNIGTAGRSYGAGAQWELAPLGSPHLGAMAAHVYGENRFRDVHYVGGTFQLALSLLAAVTFRTNLATSAFGPVFDDGRVLAKLPLIDLDREVVGGKIQWYRDWLQHPTYDTYWNAIDTSDKYGRIAAPAFLRGGWFDPYADGILRLWSGMRQKGGSEKARQGSRVLIGPWSHGEPEGTRLGDLDFGPHSYCSIIEEEKRWFDYWLRGRGDGMQQEPPLKIFVMGINQWRFESEWPPDRIEPSAYYLHSQGRANSVQGDGSLSLIEPGSEEPDRFDYDPHNPVPSIGGTISTAGWGWSSQGKYPLIPGPVDQRVIESRGDVLVYTGSELARDLEVVGPVALTLYADSSAPDTDFTARLVDVHPEGRALVMAEGIVRARYRHGHERLELLQPPGGVLPDRAVSHGSRVPKGAPHPPGCFQFKLSTLQQKPEH